MNTALTEISLDRPLAERANVTPGLSRLALIPIVVGLLTAASLLSLIYQENRAVQYRIEAVEGWSAYQMKTVRAAIEEDPNLKTQYTQEQEVLSQRAQGLKEKSSVATRGVRTVSYATLFLLLGAATAVFALAVNSIHAGYAGLLMGIVGVGLGVTALF